MTNLTFKLILILLTAVLMSGPYIGWIKSKKDSKYGITAIMANAVLIGLLIYAELFQTTMFEFLLFLAIAMLLFVFRKRIGGFLKKLPSQKGGKIKVTAAVMLFPVGIWLALALFYRTPLGMPIGVKNYLYHKYDEEFETAGFWAATPAGHPINEFTCWPKNGNKQTDSFNVVRKNTLSVGSRSYASDNYYGIIIREDYENYISNFIEPYFDNYEVSVYFKSGGLSNTKYMTDEFDKNTSLSEFLAFQRDEENIRGCNFATVFIHLYNQPSIKEKENFLLNANKFLSSLIAEYRNLGVFFTTNSKYNMSSLITHDGKLEIYKVDDGFFKLEEE